VPITWSILGEMGCHIRFAHTSFVWSNLAKNRAGVTVIIVGLDFDESGSRTIMTGDSRRTVTHINPYLTEHRIKIVEASRRPLFVEPVMDYGVYYSKSAGLILESLEKDALLQEGFPENLIKSFLGSTEFINGDPRYCLWLGKIFVPIVSSENREYFPVGLVGGDVIPTNKAFALYDAPLWNMAAHRLSPAPGLDRHRLRQAGNTLPLLQHPRLEHLPGADADREKQGRSHALRGGHPAGARASLPATIADLYDPEHMPADLRAAHERNDEVLERIYIGRRFKNDTERLEKLFDLYTKMTASAAPAKGKKRKAGANA
jgi:hypothetical protein